MSQAATTIDEGGSAGGRLARARFASFVQGRGALVAVLAAVALSTALGLVNGLVIAKARIQPFIVTLAMMIAARGLVLAYTGEKSVGIGKASETLTSLGRDFV